MSHPHLTINPPSLKQLRRAKRITCLPAGGFRPFK